jgi:chromosome segregation ATPase
MGKGKRGTGARKRAPGSTASSRMLILLEQIQEQNRATIEAVYSESRRLEKKLVDRFNRLEAKVDNLEQAVRFHTAELKTHSSVREELRNLVLELRRDFAQFQEKIEGSRGEVAGLDRRISSLESRLLP